MYLLIVPECIMLVWKILNKSSLFVYLPSSFLLFVLQRVSEKVGGAEGTKLDVDFTEMEKACLSSLLLLLLFQDVLMSFHYYFYVSKEQTFS